VVDLKLPAVPVGSTPRLDLRVSQDLAQDLKSKRCQVIRLVGDVSVNESSNGQDNVFIL
jgi:hypothetical protein